MSEEIRLERRGRVAVVTIDRPQVRNALGLTHHRQLRAIFETFRDDPALWVAILTGAGDVAFCAGADLKEQAHLTQHERQALIADPPVFGGITREFACPKPIVCAVNGLALGGGTELALACDLVVAAENATFGLPEPRRGRAPGAGGMQRIVRQVPLKQAMGLLLTGRHIDAREAQQLGLVNEIVPRGDALTGALRWADEILRCAPLAIQTIKESVAAGLREPSLDVALAADKPRLAALRLTDDYAEGSRAFVEKRPPRWRNR